MKKLNATVLFLTDPCQNPNRTKIRIIEFKKIFEDNGIRISDIEDLIESPINTGKYFDILFWDWGRDYSAGSPLHFADRTSSQFHSIGIFNHYCKGLLDAALEMPNKVFIVVSEFHVEMMNEARKSFQDANFEVPSNVFLTVTGACEYLNNCIQPRLIPGEWEAEYYM